MEREFIIRMLNNSLYDLLRHDTATTLVGGDPLSDAKAEREVFFSKTYRKERSGKKTLVSYYYPDPFCAIFRRKIVRPYIRWDNEVEGLYLR